MKKRKPESREKLRKKSSSKKKTTLEPAKKNVPPKRIMAKRRLVPPLNVAKKETSGSNSKKTLRTDLPFSYNQTKLTLLVRDPFWAYSFWDFSEETWKWIENFRRQEPKARAVLRIHNLDRQTHHDLEVDLNAKNWYIHLGIPDASFEVELGLLDPAGNFHLIAKGNRIRTPRSGPSNIIDQEWDSAQFDEIYRLSGGGKMGRGSELFSRFKRN